MHGRLSIYLGTKAILTVFLARNRWMGAWVHRQWYVLLRVKYERGLITVYHDEILNDLRRTPAKRLITHHDKEEEKDKKAGNGRYAIPRGGLFKLVSFPNYLCEWLVNPLLPAHRLMIGSNGHHSLSPEGSSSSLLLKYRL